MHRVVAHRDRTLVLDWAGGAQTLGPDQPPEDGRSRTRYLSASSDSQASVRGGNKPGLAFRAALRPAGVAEVEVLTA